MEFTGKHVIVTGGSSGIGLATARQFAALGAKLSLIARDAGKLNAAAEELRRLGKGTVEVASADVSQSAEVKAAIATLEGKQGGCDVLVTSAGITHPGYFEQLEDRIFREMMEVDYFGTLYAVQAVVPGMMARKSGNICAVSSAAGLIGVFGYTAYGAAKFAVRGLMEALCQEMKPYNIAVSIAYPPDTDTPQLAFENTFKPLETRHIAGAIKPISAEKMASAIVAGIAAKRRSITADTQTALLSRIGGLVEPILASSFDGAVKKARKERGLE
jgi:3-dehydrosphinganine reductase